MAEHPVVSENKYLRSILALMIAMAVFLVISSAIILYVALHAGDATDAIKDCTVSTGTCYQDASKRSGGAVKAINMYTAAAISCSKRYDTTADINRCAVAEITPQIKR